jgi:cell division protein FtsI (penicillin-binding protein 3)
VVVLQPETGEILAMASYPTFDPSQREGLQPGAMRNRAVTDTFEPGSTLKMIAVAGALEEGIVDTSTPIETPRTIEVGEETYSDPGSNPPVMSVGDVVTHSSNIGTINIQQRLGDERHYGYLDAFGLGRPAAIDFPGEASGFLPHVSQWCVPCGESAAIGYGISVTPLQMAAAYAVIANDGEWVEPYIVADIIQGDGTRETTEPRRRRVVSRATAVTMRRLLQRVVDEGTGKRAQVEGFAVGGKTGTSDKFDVEEGRYSTTETFASFIGMAPIDDPQIVVAVVLDSPQGELDDGANLKFGGASAAPVFAAIVQPVLNQLGVPRRAESAADG